MKTEQSRAFWAMVACIAVSVGCATPQGNDTAASAEVPAAIVTARVPLRISSDWSTEQQGQILEGLAPWMAVMSIPFSLTIAPCTYTFPGCIAPVELDNPVMVQAQQENASDASTGWEQTVVGVKQDNGAILIWRDVSNLPRVLEHETGHRLGLGHTNDGGIMAAVQELDSTVPPISQESLDELAALGELR